MFSELFSAADTAETRQTKNWQVWASDPALCSGSGHQARYIYIKYQIFYPVIYV